MVAWSPCAVSWVVNARCLLIIHAEASLSHGGRAKAWYPFHSLKRLYPVCSLDLSAGGLNDRTRRSWNGLHEATRCDTSSACGRRKQRMVNGHGRRWRGTGGGARGTGRGVAWAAHLGGASGRASCYKWERRGRVGGCVRS